MINKQNLWFVTLFSLILILGIYYISLSDEEINILKAKEDVTETIEVTESDLLVSLQVEEDEQVLKEMNTYQDILLNESTTIEEKNDAYNSLQAINDKKSESEKIKNLITEEFNYDSFIKIENDIINITIANDEHNTKIANDIIKCVQKLYDKQKYITVKFE